MAKSISKKPSATPSPKQKNSDLKWIIGISNLVGRFGLKTVVVSVILFTFVVDGTAEQHKEFIDKFILLKFTNGETLYLFIILLFIIAAYTYTIVHYRSRIKEKDERIKELQRDKTTYQNKLLR